METVTEVRPENPMRTIKLAKVTVHINVGKSGEELERARKVLGDITGQKTCTKQAKQTVKEWGITEGEPANYSTNDTLRLSIPIQKVLNHIKFEKGNYGLVIAGRNLGKSGKIVEFQQGTATRPAMVTIEDPTGSKFDTKVEYTFVVGTDKPAIKLEASQ